MTYFAIDTNRTEHASAGKQLDSCSRLTKMSLMHYLFTYDAFRIYWSPAMSTVNTGSSGTGASGSPWVMPRQK